MSRRARLRVRERGEDESGSLGRRAGEQPKLAQTVVEGNADYSI